MLLGVTYLLTVQVAWYSCHIGDVLTPACISVHGNHGNHGNHGYTVNSPTVIMLMGKCCGQMGKVFRLKGIYLKAV